MSAIEFACENAPYQALAEFRDATIQVMVESRQLTPIPRNRAPLPTKVSIADLSSDELAEFIEPVELPKLPVAFEIADYELDQLER